MVFQENRTAKNLFGNDTALIANGFHVVTSGQSGMQTITLSLFDVVHGQAITQRPRRFFRFVHKTISKINLANQKES